MQSVGWRLSFARMKALGLLLMPRKHICRLMDVPNASEGVPDGIPDTGVFEGALYWISMKVTSTAEFGRSTASLV